jgi:hypothetical protein
LRNLATRKARALLEQRCRPQQATDMFGAEWRFLARQRARMSIHG